MQQACSNVDVWRRTTYLTQNVSWREKACIFLKATNTFDDRNVEVATRVYGAELCAEYVSDLPVTDLYLITYTMRSCCTISTNVFLC